MSGHRSGGAGERWALLAPVFAVLLVGIGLPLAAVAAASAQGGGSAYAEALGSPMFLSAAARTALMAVIVTAVDVVLGVIYALAAAAATKRVAAFLFGALVFSMWTSVMVRSFGWMLLELPKGALHWAVAAIGGGDKSIDLYQTVYGMYPPMFAVMLPFMVLPIVTALNTVEREQLLAAATLGARPWLTFRSVTLPAIKGSIASGATLVFVMSLGFYVTPLLLGGPSNLTVSGLIDLEMRSANRPELGAAMGVLLAVSTICVYFAADRLFRVSEKWG
jgi:putative spermidine/putrescine transport system permease protein